MRWLEFPERPIYHIAKGGEPIRPLCSSFAPYGPDFTAYVVETRSDGRRHCKECFKRAVRQKIKLPPMTSWERSERADWKGEPAIWKP